MYKKKCLKISVRFKGAQLYLTDGAEDGIGIRNRDRYKSFAIGIDRALILATQKKTETPTSLLHLTRLKALVKPQLRHYTRNTPTYWLTVTLFWWPSHAGIWGKKRADNAAKCAIKSPLDLAKTARHMLLGLFSSSPPGRITIEWKRYSCTRATHGHLPPSPPLPPRLGRLFHHFSRFFTTDTLHPTNHNFIYLG